MRNKVAESGISNDDFIRHFFSNRDKDQNAYPVVCGFAGDPHGKEARWGVVPYKGRSLPCMAEDLNTYYCVSTFAPRDKQYRRTKDQFVAMHMLMIDDVGHGQGAKIDPMRVANLKATSWVETSEDNHQVCYKLKDPITDRDQASRLINAMIKQGLSAEADPGMAGVTRIGRLPHGINGKPKYGGWDVRLAQWNPECEYTLDELCEAFGLNLDAVEGDITGRQFDLVSAEDDPVVGILSDIGMAKSEVIHDGDAQKIHVTCPWVDNHTDAADNGAAYFVGGGFKCHHGHCESKNGLDFMVWLRDEHNVPIEDIYNARLAAQFTDISVEGDSTTAKVVPLRPDGDAGPFGDWYYLRALDVFKNARTGEEMKCGVFNNVMPRQMPRNGDRPVKPLQYFVSDLPGHIVSRSMYVPQFGEVFVHDGIAYLNDYRKNNVPKEDPEWEKHDAWKICLEHVNGLFSEENDAKVMLQWMAYNVQKPGNRILWAPMICGIQGDGKSTMRNILAAAMGHSNIYDVTTQELFSAFNAYATGYAVVCLEEVRVRGHNRHEIMNALKPLISNPEISVVKKGVGGFKALNCTNYLAFTNHHDALVLEENDRRWHVMGTRITTRKQLLSERPSSWFDKLHEAYQKHPEVIRGWLLSVPIDDFTANVPPMPTKAKRNMVSASISDDEWHVAEFVGGNEGGFLASELIDYCKRHGHSITSRRGTDVLKALGYVKSKPAKIDGVSVCVWYFPEVVVEEVAIHNVRLRRQWPE